MCVWERQAASTPILYVKRPIPNNCHNCLKIWIKVHRISAAFGILPAWFCTSWQPFLCSPGSWDVTWPRRGTLGSSAQRCVEVRCWLLQEVTSSCSSIPRAQWEVRNGPYDAWDEWSKTSDSTFRKLRKKCITRPLGVVMPRGGSRERCFLFGETNACFEGSTNKFATGKCLGLGRAFCSTFPSIKTLQPGCQKEKCKGKKWHN